MIEQAQNAARVALIPIGIAAHSAAIHRKRFATNVRASPAGKLWHEVAADHGMKPEKKRVVERGRTELAVFDVLFQCEDVARQVRRELGVTEDAERGIQVTGCGRRRSSSRSRMRWSTGSPSNAMLRATFRGKLARRIRACSSCGRLRQRAIACFQSMNGIIGLHRRRLKPRFFRLSAFRAQHLFDPLQHDTATIHPTCSPCGSAASSTDCNARAVRSTGSIASIPTSSGVALRSRRRRVAGNRGARAVVDI